MTTDSKIEKSDNDIVINEYKEANGLPTLNGFAGKKAVENGAAPVFTNAYVPINADTKGKLPCEIGTDYNFKRKIVWFNLIGFVFLHILALYGLLLCFTSASILTPLWMGIVTFAAGEGVTMGAHRMWSHKTFKARFIVRLVLILLQTVAGQNCLYIWARDHRLHHKYSDTDADPHNSNRGFFFSHMGWLMSRKHPAVICKGKTIDMSDLEADRLVMLQKTYYNPLYLIFAIAIPVAIPVLFWDETYINSFFISYMARYILSLHITWLVNSAAHMFGTKPFDKNMQPVESWIVALVSVGEGWHNYHHAFPWDYRASELGARFNITTRLIDALAFFGLAYDLRAAPEHMIKHRAVKAGDGSHPMYGHMVGQETPYGEDKQHILKEAEQDVVLERDAATGETTTVNRNVKKKQQATN